MQRRNCVAGRRVRGEQPVHAGYSGIQQEREINPRPLGQAYALRRGVPALRAGGRYCVRTWVAGGRLFATDSNQSLRTAGFNNSSRIVIVNPMTGQVTPFITGLPTGDHPTEQLAFKGGWIYWSQGSTTNSGVVGRDNGGGANQPDIPCQDIKLSNNTFDSGGGVFSTGYSLFGVTQFGVTIPAFFNASTGLIRQGVCDGAILRAQLSNPGNIQAFSWGYRNGYAIRFPPKDHPLDGGIVVGENGADERGARPTNNAPDGFH